jgi:hypothetical protein
MVVGAKFALTKLLDERARSTVFEARHVALGRRVAIEILDLRVGADAQAIARLQQAAAAASSVEHPNVMPIHDVARDPITDAYFVVRRLLDGRRLRAVIEERGRMRIAEALDLLVPIMAALEAVHRLHVVHGGVRPESIFLAHREGEPELPTLVDFGLAQIEFGPEEGEDPRAAMRAIRYLAPEQARGETVDARTDVHGLGVVLFELLSGRTPYAADTAEHLRQKIASGAPARIESLVEVHPATARLVARAIEPDRQKRFPSVAEMLRAALATSVDGSGLGAELAARHKTSLGDLVERAHTIWSAPRTTPMELAAAPSSDGLGVAELGRLRANVERPTAIDFAPDAGAETSSASMIRNAHAALQLNALDSAAARAESARAHTNVEHEAIAELRLIEAIARAWQGRWADADDLLERAMSGLATYGARFLAALGTRATTTSALGRHERLTALSQALLGAPEPARHCVEYVVTAARLAIALIHAGQVTPAEGWLGDARARAVGPLDVPLVHAWIESAQTESARHAGRLFSAYQHALSAAARFEETGDARNACRMRGVVGNLLVELGAFAEAAAVLADDLASAEAMGLYFVCALHGDLGRARLRLGDAAAIEELARGADEAKAQRDHWHEAFARGYLARAAVSADPARADREARLAIEVGGASPATRAFALAVLAELALNERRGPTAMGYASEAYQLLARLRGVESGQLYIRLQFASALEATGRGIEARAVLESARDRLIACANEIADPKRRATFLNEVPENAATLAWIRRLTGSVPPAG